MKKLLVILLTSSVFYGQDTIFYKKGFIKVNTLKESVYYKIVSDNPQDNKQNIEQIYYTKGNLKLERIVTKDKEQPIISRGWYPEGMLHIETNYKDGKRDGYFKSFYRSGKIKRIEEYKKGKRIKEVCYDESGNEIPFFEFEEKPRFPGGHEALSEFLRKNIYYRNPSNNPQDKHRVIVTFDVETDGSVSNIEIFKSANSYIDDLVLQALTKLPKWIPGKVDGEFVTVLYSLPVTL